MIKVITNFKKLKTVSEEIKDFKKAMKIANDLQMVLSRHPNGVGLSAIQIGIPKKIGIIKYQGETLYLLNTKLSIKTDIGTIYDEGCLSLPGKLVNTERYGKIEISDDFLGKRGYNLKEHGLLPVIFQHEIDHFEGKTIFNYQKKPFRRNQPKIGRNAPCPCNSGKKFKKCPCGLFLTS